MLQIKFIYVIINHQVQRQPIKIKGENNMKHICIITLVTLMIVVSAIATKAGIDTITDYHHMRTEMVQDI